MLHKNDAYLKVSKQGSADGRRGPTGTRGATAAQLTTECDPGTQKQTVSLG